jgi:hypothetical protein
MFTPERVPEFQWTRELLCPDEKPCPVNLPPAFCFHRLLHPWGKVICWNPIVAPKYDCAGWIFSEGEKNLVVNCDAVNPKFWCKLCNFHNAPQKSKKMHKKNFTLAART